MRGWVERIKKAVEQAPTIAVDRDKVREAKGHTEEFLKMLGVRKSDLKRLETNGMAVRGLMPVEEKTALGRRKSYRQTRWILLRD